MKLPWWPPSHYYCHLFKYCSSWLLAVTPKIPLVVNTISIDSSTHLRSYLRSIWQLLNAMAKEVEIRVTVDSWVRLQLDIINWFALSKKVFGRYSVVVSSNSTCPNHLIATPKNYSVVITIYREWPRYLMYDK